MKKFLQFFSVAILLLTNELNFAQTGSDYYLPLSVGNQLNLHTSIAPNWWHRATTFVIEGTDEIAGQLCFRELGKDQIDASSEIDTFHIFWLRKDTGGNVMMNAISIDGTSNPDSALIVDFNLFPNEFLTPGYSRTYNFEKITIDSVLSVTESVTVPAGTFNNCIVILETQFDSSGNIDFQEYHYYAYGVGMVKNVRTIPNNDSHTDELMSYVVTGVNDDENNQSPANFILSQNYPNPFNPTTNISYNLPVDGFVSIKIFDIMGSEVSTLINENQKAGSYSTTFNGVEYSSGLYICRMTSGSYKHSIKMLMLK